MPTEFDFAEVTLHIIPKKGTETETGAEIKASSPKTFSFDVTFVRKYVANPQDEDGGVGSTQVDVPAQEPVLIHDSLRITRSEPFGKDVVLHDVYLGEPLKFKFLYADGRTAVEKTAILRKDPAGDTDGSPENTISTTIELSKEDIERMEAIPSRPGEVLSDIKRSARLVSLDPQLQQINFPLAQLLVVPIRFNDLPPGNPIDPSKSRSGQPSLGETTPTQWKGSGFEDIVRSETPRSKPVTGSKICETSIADAILGLNWKHTRVAVDGSFTATFEPGSWNAWAWMLFGGGAQHPIIGLVVEPLAFSIDRTRSIFLPQPAKRSEAQPGSDDGASKTTASAPSTQQPTKTGRGRVPVDVSAAELATNPDVYTEDPGAFCRPFSNPQRVLSERSFFSVLRTEMPAISAESSVKLEEPAQLDFDPPKDMLAALRESTSSAIIAPSITLTMSEVPTVATGKGFRTDIGQGLAMYLDRLPEELQKHYSKLSHSRVEMSATQPLQWNSESTRYQATTVARGHILEFRVRTRSNGYSLGGVAKTLTLAPRQTKRIQKISWSRAEQSSRAETQDSQDAVDDLVSHENSYENAVAANLTEWAQGSSKSKVSAAAFAAGGILGQLPIAVGGGAATSTATSGSQQSGGRDASAKEEGQWRGAIERHGESVRKFESTIVQEVAQEEEVTGTVEVVRNINYAHSLTVIYHNILRHQRVDTEFAGVRECLFVPFSMKPFTMARAYRWRETIRRILRDRRFNHAMEYLRDVLTGFRSSTIPPGRRADHAIRSMYGSVYIELGIARPMDNDKGEFSQDSWTTLTSLLGLPTRATWQSLAGLSDLNREPEFQRLYAPGIAAKWCNSLQLWGANRNLEADFTLATRHVFGRQVRVDFQVDTSNMNLGRAQLTTLVVRATRGLPPGSLANVRSINYTYQTDYVTRSISLGQGANDLVDPTSGGVDREGAAFQSPITLFEAQNLRMELVHDTMELLQHLNEHIEYYHRMIWWYMDRDRLFMLLDGFYVPRLKPETSIANIVERNPLGVAGNSLIFRVSAGCFLGTPELPTANDLDSWYRSSGPPADPMHISLPTDGLYAQTVMDECEALEEHYGSLDWALNDADPELGSIDANLLTSRRSDPNVGTTPTKLPDTLISLQNASPAPAPQGFDGILGTIGNANLFRDMAGLAGTQGLAAQGLETTSGLAANALNQAAALKLAEMASKTSATANADRKLATLQRAVKKELIKDEAVVSQIATDIQADSNGIPPTQPKASEEITPRECGEVIKILEGEQKKGNITNEEKKDGIRKRTRNLPGGRSPAPSEKLYPLTIEFVGISDRPLAGHWECSLGQVRLVDNKNTLVEIARGEGEDLSEPGIVKMVLPRIRGRHSSIYTLLVKGYIFDGFMTPAQPAWMEQKLNNVNIPDQLLDQNGSVTATVRAMHGKVTTSKTTGKELSNDINQGRKSGGESSGSVSIEGDPSAVFGAGGKLVDFIAELAKGIATLKGEGSVTVSGELSSGETQSKLEKIEETQTWEIEYYTGTFEHVVEVI
ncbi:hypothetical protein A1O1_05299 [Capronia coronata CBS 617.96]|uniref:Uncharacterized protein n=1 Tax=Capronia coronata CBS 617.96 TaxID=1182541 RepID=W9Z1J7_9EURO|nr:uncharacterized protein A1O1_05299 [Capronia coronata CBS 617.96]EXJ88369.1 hypothetical protein A1O1_05299 [Capronia coronata CBS 617.96]